MSEELLLNNLTEYQITKREASDDRLETYDVLTTLNKDRTHISRIRFNEIYQQIMDYFMSTEEMLYNNCQTGKEPPSTLLREMEYYAKKIAPSELDPNFNSSHTNNDLRVLMNKLKDACFGYYILQPLIDDPLVTDIHVNGYDKILVRTHGKTMLSNAHFIDENDIYRFVNGLAIRNRKNILAETKTTFTDTHANDYVLRFSVINTSVTPQNFPYLHIRKEPKHKASLEDLVNLKMLTPVVKNWLIERTKTAKCIAIAGAPGSGKTVLLNALLEYVPKSRDTLVIQESDELFTSQPQFMFEHPNTMTDVYGRTLGTSLEDLGKIALVQGCNEFIIGEVKGGEMRSAATLLNSGGYSMFTLHSDSINSIHKKLADLITTGSNYSVKNAYELLEPIDTLVYMQHFAIQEIAEVAGFDNNAQPILKKLYKKD